MRNLFNKIIPEHLETLFASAERSARAELDQLVSELKTNHLLSVVLKAVGGFVAVLNEHRQILIANDELLSALNADDSCLVGLRPGEAVNCAHFSEGPGGCGTGESCRSCGAGQAVLKSQETHECVDGECCLEMDRDGRIETVVFSVRAMPVDLPRGKMATVLVLHDISAIRRVEAQKATEAHFKSIFNNSSVGIVVADPDRQTFYEVNDALCRMLGYDRDQFLSLGVKDIHPPESLPKVAEAIQKQLSGACSLAESIPVLCADGRIFYADISATPFYMNGKLCLLGMFIDVSRRLESERALQESELRLRNIFDNSGIGILVMADAGERFVLTNHAQCEMLGYEHDQLLSLSIKDLYPDNVLPHIKEEFQKLLAGESTVAKEIPMLRSDETLFYADISSAAFVMNGESCLLGMFTDVTDRRQARLGLEFNARHLEKLVKERTEAVESAGKTYHLLFESTAEAVMLHDLAGTVLECNPAAVQMFGGRSEEDLIGLTPVDYSPVYQPNGMSSAEYSRLAWLKAEEEGSCLLTWCSRRLDNGNEFSCEVLLSAVQIDGRSMVQSMSRDITVRLQSEALVNLQNERLRALQSILSDPAQLKEETVLQNIIRKSCELLGMEMAYIGRIEGSRRIVEYVYPEHGRLQSGDYHELNSICCKFPLEAGGPVLVQNLGVPEFLESDCYQVYGQRSYAGAPLYTKRGIYGVLSLASTVPRALPFDQEDHNFLLSIAGLTGKILERVLNNQELVARNERLELFNDMMVTRESRIIELKEEVNSLLIKSGQPIRYEEIWNQPDEYIFSKERE